MLDTAGKSGGRLTTHLGADRLLRFIAACREHQLLCGLAGGLEPPDVPRLLALRPDVLGFRGALCGHNGRSGPLDPQAVALIRALIPPETPAASPPPAATTVVDRIFVRDLVVTALALALTVTLATLSWNLFEKPLVDMGHRLRYRVAALAAKSR